MTTKPMTSVEQAFVWLGGIIFVGSLAACAAAYLTTWGAGGPLAWPDAIYAAAVNAAVFTVFAAHHSLFARPAAKAWLARTVPERLLRSTYVWIASALLLAVVGSWRPIGGVLYIHGGALAVAH